MLLPWSYYNEYPVISDIKLLERIILFWLRGFADTSNIPYSFSFWEF